MPYLVTPQSFASVSEEWQQLLPQCASDSLFLTPLWQDVWWREMGSGELQLLRVAQDDRLLGVAPLACDGPEWRFLGDTSVFDYQDFIVSKGAETSFFQALLDYLEEETWETLDLVSLRDGSPTLEVLPGLARERGHEVVIEVEGVAPGVCLPVAWDDYLARLSRKDRHELRRKLRRLQRAGEYHTVAVRDAQELPAAMDEFLSLMRTSRVDKEQFLTPEREHFFRSIGQELSHAGQIQLYFLQVNGSRAAGALCFDYRGRRLLYNSGYDLDFSPLSVSLLLKAFCLQEAIEQGMDYFDFLRGAEPYKYDLGAKDVSLYHMTIRRHPSLD